MPPDSTYPRPTNEIRIYLAGPMSGILEHNFPAFNSLAAALRADGYTVVNPAELDNGETDKEWGYYIRRDLPVLLTCDRVVVLPGWQSSKGARIEVFTAFTVGMGVFRSILLGNLRSLRPLSSGEIVLAVGSLLLQACITE